MIDNGRGGRRHPSRSLTRDPRDEEIYREGKRRKRDDERKRDEDGRIVDDENPQILEFWWFKPDDNGNMEQVLYYHDVTKEGPMSQDEIEKRRPFKPTDPHFVPGSNELNAMQPKAKACGNKPSPKGTSDESRVGGFFNPNAPQAPPGVSDQSREGGLFDQHGRTDERGWSGRGWGERSWSARGWGERSWNVPEPPKAVAPPPRMQQPQAPQAMHKAAPAGAPAAHAAVACKQTRVCKPTSSTRLGVWQNANDATPLAIEEGTGKDMPISDKPTAKDARDVDTTVEAAPGNVHRPDQQKHGAGGEDHDHELPLWARYIIDITNDIVDDECDPDPEDQCELASPATRLLTASGYNRQH